LVKVKRDVRSPIEVVSESVNAVLEKSIIYLLGEFGQGIKLIQAGKTIQELPPDFFNRK